MVIDIVCGRRRYRNRSGIVRCPPPFGWGAICIINMFTIGIVFPWHPWYLGINQKAEEAAMFKTISKHGPKFQGGQKQARRDQHKYGLDFVVTLANTMLYVDPFSKYTDGYADIARKVQS